MFYREILRPFVGTDSFAFYQNIESAKDILDLAKIGYTEELWESSSETVPNPWNVLVVEGIISLFFAKMHITAVEHRVHGVLAPPSRRNSTTSDIDFRIRSVA